MEPKTSRKIVSRREYLFKKTLAIILSACVTVCVGSIALLLLSLPLFQYVDSVRISHLPPHTMNSERFYYTDIAMVGAFFLTPLLLCCALPLWWGKRKTWEAVEAIQSTFADNTADLSASKSLVRASSEPQQTQQAVLLRTAGEEYENRVEELVRASQVGE